MLPGTILQIVIQIFVCVYMFTNTSMLPLLFILATASVNVFMCEYNEDYIATFF